MEDQIAPIGVGDGNVEKFNLGGFAETMVWNEFVHGMTPMGDRGIEKEFPLR